MKFTIFLLILISNVYSSSYVFLAQKYNTNIELEAKIISDMAKASISDDIKLYIPNISNEEKEIYSTSFTLVNNCNLFSCNHI